MNDVFKKSLHIALFASALVSSLAAHAEPPVMQVAEDDAVMRAAMAKARSALPSFWKSFDKPGRGETAFALKISLMAPSQKVEHIWVNSVKRLPDGRLTGKLDNEPEALPGAKAGDTVTFSDANISDWMFTRKGKIVGNETMRPLLAQMSKEEADALRALMETP